MLLKKIFSTFSKSNFFSKSKKYWNKLFCGENGFYQLKLLKRERNKSIKCKSVWVAETNEYRGLFGHFEIVKLLKKTESNVAMKS